MKTQNLVRHMRVVVICHLLLLLFTSNVFAQVFGKNKVQFRSFDWKYIQSKHFDVYYYENGRYLADFVADVAETAYVSIRKDLRYDIEKRIPILVYNCHNDWEQTNTSLSLFQEGVEGFTELFKDRVVIAFRGSYEEFRHLIHHELTHAIMFQMLYGGGMGSMVMAMTRFRVPDWVLEGSAEYESSDWNALVDMYVRDAAINGYIPPIQYLTGFWSYKGGQSVFKYLADTYGKPKIGEVLNKISMSRSVENGLKSSIGVGVEELSKRWHKYLRKAYWPDIEGRDEPEDIAKRLTDHAKDRHYINESPSLSPRGDKVVYLTDKSDYMEIHMMSTLDEDKKEKLVEGQRSDIFESMHQWTKLGMDWSPDGRKITFAAKSGAKDGLFIMDVKKKDVLDSFYFKLDGVFSPTWSPDGKAIVFMGINKGQSDLYLYGLDDKQLTQLTDDIYSDLEPKWSPKGDEIVFISDRGDDIGGKSDFKRMQRHQYSQHDIYTISVSTGSISRQTSDEFREHSPAFSPEGEKIAFISDRNGIDNIWIMDRKSNEVYPITNLISGVSHLSWSRDGSRLAFSSWYNGGYDIYLLNNPIDLKFDPSELRPTVFWNKREKEPVDLVEQTEDEKLSDPKQTSYKNFVFGREFRDGRIKAADMRKEFPEAFTYKDENGEYKTRKYKVSFSPDIITGSAGYSQFFGLQGSTLIAFSDLLGNHQINLYTDLFYNIKNSNFQVAYNFLPKRTDIGASIFHFSYLYYTYYTDGYYLYPAYLRDRNYGITFYASRPFSRFQRFDLGVTALAIDRDYGSIDPYYYYYYGYTGGDFMTDEGNLFKRRLLLLQLGYNTDTVLWGMTGPVNGGRSTVSFAYSPKISETYGLDYWTLRADWRKYMRIKRDYTFVTRLAGGVSGGQQPQRFLLGGMMGWINYRYNQFSSMNWGDDLFYFSSIETPFRGYPYYEMIGSRFFLANLEFRFPLVQYLLMGWPLPFGFQNVRGAIFMDIGSAWSDDGSWKPFASGESVGFFSLEDIKAGFGIGARMNLGFFLLKYDVAWPTNFDHTGKAVHYFTMGAEF